MEVKNSFNNGHGATVIYYEEVNICPVCHHAIKPVFLHGHCNIINKKAAAMLLCTACNNAFIKSFDFSILSSYCESENSKTYLAPTKIKTSTFSKYIQSISPSFIEIYNQAESAEQAGLSQICGVGYRKAIEFLIKDYITLDMDEENKTNILKKFLGNCIKDDIANENIKIVASRAVWLGNSETHYLRVYDDKDVNDLKRLINLTVHWIEMELMTKEAQEDIEYKK